jgi:putative SOS response-associated peptidase YedK
MCYSAQVVQIIRKLHRELGIRLDYEEAAKLFFQRLDDPTISISRGFEANFIEPVTETGIQIQSAIREYREQSAVRLEQALFSQRTRLVNGQRSLSQKDTKKAREEVRIAGSKVAALTEKLSDLRRTEANAADNRIFPMMYAGVIVKINGKNLLTPMRYACRPAGKPASFDKKFPGLYNARRDNLERFWSDQFGRHHAVMVVESFYENVQLHASEHRELLPGESSRNVVLQFTPSPAQPLFVACLWSPWTDSSEGSLRGFAAITDDPPPDIAAAGHDRCIVNLKPEHVEAWLSPETRTRGELQELLSERAVAVFQHEALKAA